MYVQCLSPVSRLQNILIVIVMEIITITCNRNITKKDLNVTFIFVATNQILVINTLVCTGLGVSVVLIWGEIGVRLYFKKTHQSDLVTTNHLTNRESNPGSQW